MGCWEKACVPCLCLGHPWKHSSSVMVGTIMLTMVQMLHAVNGSLVLDLDVQSCLGRSCPMTFFLLGMD